MTITIRSAEDNRNLQYLALQKGRAYKLVSSYQQDAVGRIYLQAAEGRIVNISTGTVREPNPNDLYVEVDLEILVKEKHNA